MHKYYNPNPIAARVGDCVVRAISCATSQTWEKTYIDLCIYGLMFCDMPSSNNVWGKYLKSKGFKRYMISDSCPDCYTTDMFTKDHPVGTYLLSISGHLVTVIDGIVYDTWDSSGETPIFYWCKDEGV